MKTFLMIAFVSGLVSCGNGGEMRTKLDSTVKRVENAAVLDSIKTKGETILDSVKRKGGELWDSTKSKGGKLIDKAGEQLEKDSLK